MTETQRTVAQEIERYLRTGESDPYRSAWSGGFLQREKRAHDDLRDALVREVRRLTERRFSKERSVVPKAARYSPLARGTTGQTERNGLWGKTFRGDAGRELQAGGRQPDRVPALAQSAQVNVSRQV